MNKKFLIGFLLAFFSLFILAYLISFYFMPNLFGSCWGGIHSDCVSNPLGQLSSAIERAQVGLNASSEDICMNHGETVDAQALLNRVSSLNSITFICKGAAVCKKGDILKVETNRLDAVRSVKFTGLVSCAQTDGNYDCIITIQNARSA